MLLLPATAVIVPASQEPVNPFGVATTNPVGSVSVNPSPASEIVFGLLRLNVTVVVVPGPMLTAPNVLLRTSGIRTVRLAVPGVPRPALEFTGPVVLLMTPGVAG